jgi:hypothetical protein
LQHKSRAIVQKVKQSEIVSPRRSPRVAASIVDVRPRQSPRVSSILKDAAAASKAASIDKFKKVKKRVATKKVTADVVKKGVSKGNKDTKVASKASKASGSGKKLERKATNSPRSDKDEEYKGENEYEDFEDTDAMK